MVERRKVDLESSGRLCADPEMSDDDNLKVRTSRNRFLVMLATKLPFLAPGGDARVRPRLTMKQLLFKLAFGVWCIVVFMSLLSLLGFRVNPTKYIQDGPLSSARASLGNIVHIPFSGQGTDSNIALGDESSAGDGEGSAAEDDDDVPQQQISAVKVFKFTRQMERDAACVELDCQAKCKNKRISKCGKSKSCITEREKICRKRCRKARCEDRCKDEPKLGYVEREQKMDKCKESCGGSTVVHNKCIKKCHSEFKPCKQRCHDTAGKFQCDRVTEAPIIAKEVEAVQEDLSEDDEGEDDEGSEPVSEVKSKGSLVSSLDEDDDDELL